MAGGMFGPNSRFVQHMEQFAGAASEQKAPSPNAAAKLQEALKATHSDGPIAEAAEKGVG